MDFASIFAGGGLLGCRTVCFLLISILFCARSRARADGLTVNAGKIQE